MGDYYEEIYSKIEKMIESKDFEEAKRLLNIEMSMPYIPEPYFTKFGALMNSLSSTATKENYYNDIDSIIDGFLGNEQTKAKAIISLEQMNLRLISDDLVLLLESNLLEDQLKRYVLMLMMEQEIEVDLNMILDNNNIVISTSKLKDQFSDESVINVYHELHSLYEDSNPSFLNFCLEELQLRLMKIFPFVDESINVAEIIKSVESYLST